MNTNINKARFEYKYLVPNYLLDELRNDLAPYMKLDGFAQKMPNNEYTVRSIYYDSPKFFCYREKLDGVKIRNKFRIRGYNEQANDSITFLEIKHKNTDCISKHRAPLYFENVAKSLKNNNVEKVLPFSGTGIEQKDARKFLYHYNVKNLVPAVLIVYDREAFFGKFDSSLRLTFDKNLRSIIYPDLDRLYDETNTKPAMVNHFIFEVKFFGTLPAWIKSLITKYGFVRESLSKYTITLESHREFTNPKFSRMNMIAKRREHYYA